MQILGCPNLTNLAVPVVGGLMLDDFLIAFAIIKPTQLRSLTLYFETFSLHSIVTSSNTSSACFKTVSFFKTMYISFNQVHTGSYRELRYMSCNTPVFVHGE